MQIVMYLCPLGNHGSDPMQAALKETYRTWIHIQSLEEFLAWEAKIQRYAAAVEQAIRFLPKGIAILKCITLLHEGFLYDEYLT